MKTVHNLRRLSNHLVNHLSGVLQYINLTTEPSVPRELKAARLARLARTLWGQTFRVRLLILQEVRRSSTPGKDAGSEGNSLHPLQGSF
jgi:hypothetical protein